MFRVQGSKFEAVRRSAHTWGVISYLARRLLGLARLGLHCTAGHFVVQAFQAVARRLHNAPWDDDGDHRARRRVVARRAASSRARVVRAQIDI